VVSRARCPRRHAANNANEFHPERQLAWWKEREQTDYLIITDATQLEVDTASLEHMVVKEA